MFSRISSHVDAKKLSGGFRSNISLMGSHMSYNSDLYHTSNSEYGKCPNEMGSAASSIPENPSVSTRYQRKSFSNPSQRSITEKGLSKNHGTYGVSSRSPKSGRPLPMGPGPLLPGTSLKFNKKKQDSFPGKGPFKGNHFLSQKGISCKSEPRNVTSPVDHRSLSRLKSRSLDDVRGLGNGSNDGPTVDKPMTETDMKKARKAFKISRSPSYENMAVGRRSNSSEQRALLDKMSKMKTDESIRTKVPGKDAQCRATPVVTSPSRNTALGSRTLPPTRKVSHQRADLHIDAKPPERTLKEDRPEKAQTGQRQTFLSRRLSDSAYESNGSTGSSSGRSSPCVLKEQVAETQPRKTLPSFNGKGLVGLRNLGNTCFMNSILQCLRCSKKLRDKLCTENYMEKRLEAAPGNKGGLTRAFTNVVREMWSASAAGTTVSPIALKSQVQRYAPRFVGYSQQDSQEFLRFLLEGLHDDLNIAEKVKGQMSDVSKLCDAEQARTAWENYEKRERSLISDLFVGQLKSTLTCAECNYRSLTFDPFWDLSLPIPTRTRSSLISGKVSLDDCFRRFTQEETLDGDEKPTCENCKKRRKCFKQFSIDRFPQILVIHLKRFSGLRYRTKLETLVGFPFELNLSNYAANTSSKNSEAHYSLFGVSNHSGGTYSGHYTAHCKHPDSGDWFAYSDSIVSRLAQSRVISEEAYVLFYELSKQLSYL